MAEAKNQSTLDEIRKKNLVPCVKITEDTPKEVAERQLEISRKGGVNAQKVLKAKRTMREVTEDFLNKTMGRDKAKALIGGTVGELLEDSEITVNELLTARMVKAAVDEGNVRAMEYLRDTSGNKPTDRKEVTANIMTENDKALLEKVSKRLGNMPKDGE